MTEDVKVKFSEIPNETVFIYKGQRFFKLGSYGFGASMITKVVLKFDLDEMVTPVFNDAFNSINP